MTYEVIALACEKLSYRDKLRLAQLLIQTARKQEEIANQQARTEPKPVVNNAAVKEAATQNANYTVSYVIERLLKLKPAKKGALVNSIKSMFQFQGGICDSDIEKVITELQKRKILKIEQNKVSYLK